MAYISPSTTIKILRGCPLDSGYKNTIHFDDADEQEEYFASIVKPNGGGYTYTLTDRTFQRKDAGTLKVQIPVEYLYDCNYLMFDNDRYINKWFYAFIDRVEYSNENCSIIYYTIDVMQTWMFDYELGACMVEREHTITDNRGDNIVNEGIETGELINIPLGNTYFDDYSIIIGTFLKLESWTYIQERYNIDEWREGTVYANTYSSLHYYAFPVNSGETYRGIDAIEFVFNVVEILGKTDEIVTVFMCPTSILDKTTFQIRGAIYGQSVLYNVYKILSLKDENASGTGCVVSDITITPSFNSFGNYVPHNKKLFTYPYYFLTVDNNEGEQKEYKYEYFSLGNYKFNLYSAITPDLSIRLSPDSYKAITPNYFESCSISNFPLSNWKYDTYLNWLGQNNTSNMIKTLSTFLGTASSLNQIRAVSNSGLVNAKILRRNAETPQERGAITQRTHASQEIYKAEGVSSVTGLASSILDLVSNYSYMYHQPNQMKGSLSNGLTTVGNEIKGFAFYTTTITPKNAKIIDDYFSMYGYRICELKVPNVQKYKDNWSALRPYWNYVKTVNCVVKPIVSTTSINCVPAEDAGLIEEIYNNGITFWTEPDEVDEYLNSSGNVRDNSPT